MSARLRGLIEERNRVVAQSRAIVEKAETEGRALTAEEQTNFNSAMAKQEELRVTIDASKRQAELEAEMAASGGSPLGGNGGEQRDGRGGDRGAPATGITTREDGSRVIGTGRYALNLDSDDPELRVPLAQAERRATADYRREFRASLERRSLDASSTGQNGTYLVTPIQMAQSLLMRLDDNVFIRRLATVHPLPAATSLGRLTLETDAADADWTSELKIGNEEASMGFGTRELTPHPLAKFAKISNKLVRISSIDIIGLLLDRLAYKFGITEEKALLLGDGVQKPLGLFVPSVDGIPTSRDSATGNTTTSPTFEGLINAKYKLKSGYQRNARWAFHRDGIAKVALLRDDSGASPGTGQFLWQPSTQLGQPDRVHGIPVEMSEYIPNTFTTGQYFGILGDFSFVHIADALDMQIQRLYELFAATNQTGVIMRKETDAMPVLAEAFVRLKLG